MLCQSAERPPEAPEWRYELKLDGFRAIGRRSARSAQLWSRNQKDFTRRFPEVVKGIAGLPSDTVIDGAIVALDASGRPSFNLLQGFGNAQAIVLAYDGLNPKPPTYCYLKPSYLDPNVSYFEQLRRGQL